MKTAAGTGNLANAVQSNSRPKSGSSSVGLTIVPKLCCALCKKGGLDFFSECEKPLKDEDVRKFLKKVKLLLSSQ